MIRVTDVIGAWLARDVGLTTERICEIYDVPPWMVSHHYEAPRCARLRWALRKVWPVPYKLRSSRR